MIDRYTAKLAGYPLCITVPLLAPLGIGLHVPWLSLALVFGLCPVLGALVGEDHVLPVAGLRRSQRLVAYLELLPRVFALVWVAVLAWAAVFVSHTELSAELAFVTLGVGLGSALAIPAAHELMHRHSALDMLCARLMTALCLYGHMAVEHFHHHSTLGSVSAGETAPRGISIYHFAPADFLLGLRNAWRVETARLRRVGLGWWHNHVLQDYALALGLAGVFFVAFGAAGLVLFVGQAVFAIFIFEAITFVHHYGLERAEDDEPGPQHAWAHHCTITNCLTFNNTFHGDHHLRPRTPYYDLHALYGAPRLPASYLTMFWVALVPPLWRALMDKRLDVLAEARARGEIDASLSAEYCR